MSLTISNSSLLPPPAPGRGSRKTQGPATDDWASLDAAGEEGSVRAQTEKCSQRQQARVESDVQLGAVTDLTPLREQRIGPNGVPSQRVLPLKKTLNVLSSSPTVKLDDIPSNLPESPALCRFPEAKVATLPYLSRRRAVPEDERALAVTPWPSPHPPVTSSPTVRSRQEFPDGAPAEVRVWEGVALEDLWIPEALVRVRDWLRQAQSALQSKGRGPESLVIPMAEAVRPWAASHFWDCRDPKNCKLLQPSSREDPPEGSLNPIFIREAAKYINWPDDELIHMVESGVDDHARVEHSIVLNFHHRGLRQHFDAASEAIEADITAGFIEPKFEDLPFLPCRVIPRNIALQRKWTISQEGEPLLKIKKRLTTDDSWSSLGSVTARNSGIAREDWPQVCLPTARDFGVASAILAVVADEAGIPLKGYARDLKAAYRAWGVQTFTLWLQCFVWDGGICIDKRLEFGTASAVQCFERLASLLIAYARQRQREWDALHPPESPVLQAWLRSRSDAELSYAHIYIDDSNGVTIDDHHPGWPQGRAAAHFDIVGEVFNLAGFAVPKEKDQLGSEILTLGFRVNLRKGERKIDYPPEKAIPLRKLISRMLNAKRVPRASVEELVGRLGHLTTVVVEGRIYLNPCYAMVYARRASGELPLNIFVGGDSKTASSFRESLRWFDAVLAEGVAAPLAPKLRFPEPGEEGCAFMFTDASREWGVGAWTIVPAATPTLLLMAAPYPEDLRSAAKQKEAPGLSTGALEAAALQIGSDTFRRRLSFSAILAFTDSEAVRGAVNAGTSPSEPMRIVLAAFFKARLQALAVRVGTEENRWADLASRGSSSVVQAEAEAVGLAVEVVDPSEIDWKPLRQAQAWSLADALATQDAQSDSSSNGVACPTLLIKHRKRRLSSDVDSRSAPPPSRSSQ